MVARKLRKTKKNNTNEKRKEPWWKNRIQANIVEWRKYVSDGKAHLNLKRS